MKQPQLELSRPFTAARVSPKGSFEKIFADKAECAALARRYGVPAIHAVAAELRIKPWRGGGLNVSGEVKCDLEMVSVISLEAFRQTETFKVQRYFLPNVPEGESDDDFDVISGGHIDLGEVVAETIALELDPYPRKPGETFAANDNGK
ncbi:MAG: DUF177 domain-containing protein [Proteobacteria bacterium]|nr:DUF177 domain-containing protein [Pseudomonadota bacterium]